MSDINETNESNPTPIGPQGILRGLVDMSYQSAIARALKRTPAPESAKEQPESPATDPTPEPKG